MGKLRVLIKRMMSISIVRWSAIIVVAFLASVLIAIAFILFPGLFFALLKIIG